jgi:hypothetical protein
MSNQGEIVIKYRSCNTENAPFAMNYANYQQLVCTWGIELLGWTEVEVCNPGKLQTALSLNRLLDALRKGDCYWSVLADEEWERKIAARKEQESLGRTRKRKRRSDAGVSKKGKGRAISSAKRVGDTSDDSSSESGARASKKRKGRKATTSATRDDDDDDETSSSSSSDSE